MAPPFRAKLGPESWRTLSLCSRPLLPFSPIVRPRHLGHPRSPDSSVVLEFVYFRTVLPAIIPVTSTENSKRYVKESLFRNSQVRSGNWPHLRGNGLCPASRDTVFRSLSSPGTSRLPQAYRARARGTLERPRTEAGKRPAGMGRYDGQQDEGFPFADKASSYTPHSCARDRNPVAASASS